MSIDGFSSQPDQDGQLALPLDAIGAIQAFGERANREAHYWPAVRSAQEIVWDEYRARELAEPMAAYEGLLYSLRSWIAHSWSISSRHDTTKHALEVDWKLISHFPVDGLLTECTTTVEVTSQPNLEYYEMYTLSERVLDGNFTPRSDRKRTTRKSDASLLGVTPRPLPSRRLHRQAYRYDPIDVQSGLSDHVLNDAMIVSGSVTLRALGCDGLPDETIADFRTPHEVDIRTLRERPNCLSPVASLHLLRKYCSDRTKVPTESTITEILRGQLVDDRITPVKDGPGGPAHPQFQALRIVAQCIQASNEGMSRLVA